MIYLDYIKKRLRELGVKPDKAYGQNFICDPSAIDVIAEFGRPRKGERIVEIGPGLGALTKELSTRGDLTAIEIEESFSEALQGEFPEVKIINEDIRVFELSTLGSELTVFGNLPYSFSSEILFYLLSYYKNINRAVLLLQKEFAERVASAPGRKAFGRLSVRTQLLAKARLGPILPGHVFFPAASVDSRLLELDFYDEPLFHVKDDLSFRQLLAVAFSRRRRKFLNTLVSSGQYTQYPLEEIFASLDIDRDERAENLSVEKFTQLSNCLTS